MRQLLLVFGQLYGGPGAWRYADLTFTATFASSIDVLSSCQMVDKGKLSSG